MNFLKKETETRPCTIVYATHILDNLATWPTHLVHMSLGKVKKWGSVEDMQVKVEQGDKARYTGNSQLGELVLTWLQEDLDERGPRNGKRTEGKAYESLEGKGGYGAETKK